VPRHDRCSAGVTAERETRSSPFGVLVELKRKTGH